MLKRLPLLFVSLLTTLGISGGFLHLSATQAAAQARYSGDVYSCVIIPSAPTTEDTIKLSVDRRGDGSTNDNGAILKFKRGWNSSKEVRSTKPDEHRHKHIEFEIPPLKEAGDWTLSFSFFGPNGCTTDWFTVKPAGNTGNPEYQNVKQLTPDKPYTQNIKKVDRLTISGLHVPQGGEQPWKYKLKMLGWKEAGFIRNGPDDDKWSTDDKGTLTIENICDNGEARRTDCDQDFLKTPSGKRTFSLLVFELRQDTDKDKPIFEAKIDFDIQSKVALKTIPSSPITSEIKTLTKLEISGLSPGKYKLKLDPKGGSNEQRAWSGGYLGWCKNRNSKDCGGTEDVWEVKATDNNTLTAEYICNNGNAFRSVDVCEKPFKDAIYEIEVQTEDGKKIDTVSFEVAAKRNDNDNFKGTKAPTPCYTVTGPDKKPVLDANGNPTTKCTTGLGVLDASPGGFVQTMFRFGIGFGGIIAFLLILYGGFVIATSNGDTNKVATGKAYITSAIIGLVFILAAVFILDFMGVALFGDTNNKLFNPPVTRKQQNAGSATPDPTAAPTQAAGPAAPAPTAARTAPPTANQNQGMTDTYCRTIAGTNTANVTSCNSTIWGSILSKVSSCQDITYKPQSPCGRKIGAFQSKLPTPVCSTSSPQYNYNQCLVDVAQAIQNTN